MSFLLYHCQDFDRTKLKYEHVFIWYDIWYDIGCLIRTRNCLLFASNSIQTRFLVGSVLLMLLCYCVCPMKCPCCDVRYDFRIETKFGSSLPPVVFRRAHVLLSLCACILWCPTHIVLFLVVLCTLCC